MSQNHIGESNEKVPGMSQERTEQRDFFETKEAVGTKVWALDSGIGEIIEMQHPYSFEMHNGVRWESEKIVDQYLDYCGVEGVSLKSIFPMTAAVRQLMGLLDQSRSETQAADRAAEMNMWMINRLNAVNAELTAKVQERDKYIESLTARHIALGADLDTRDKEIERLTCEKNEWISKARAESGISLKSAEENAELREEIERLRAALKQARDAFVHIGKTPFPQLWLTTTAFEIGSIDRALKGAE